MDIVILSDASEEVRALIPAAGAAQTSPDLPLTHADHRPIVGFVVMDDGVRSRVRAETATADVEVYDFGRAATLSREHARTLELAFETFARQWSAQLSGKIHVRATIAVEHVGMLTYGEYAQSLPTTTTMIVCALPDSDERLIVQVPIPTATSWIVQMVGGRVTATAEDRTFTPIEQALIRSLIGDAIDHLTGSLDGLLPTGVAVAGIQYSSQFAQVAAAGEPVIVARLSMRHGGRTVPASIMLPASVLAGFAVRASDADRSETPVSCAARWNRLRSRSRSGWHRGPCCPVRCSTSPSGICCPCRMPPTVRCSSPSEIRPSRRRPSAVPVPASPAS